MRWWCRLRVGGVAGLLGCVELRHCFLAGISRVSLSSHNTSMLQTDEKRATDGTDGDGAMVYAIYTTQGMVFSSMTLIPRAVLGHVLPLSARR